MCGYGRVVGVASFQNFAVCSVKTAIHAPANAGVHLHGVIHRDGTAKSRAGKSLSEQGRVWQGFPSPLVCCRELRRDLSEVDPAIDIELVRKVDLLQVWMGVRDAWLVVLAGVVADVVEGGCGRVGEHWFAERISSQGVVIRADAVGSVTLQRLDGCSQSREVALESFGADEPGWYVVLRASAFGSAMLCGTRELLGVFHLLARMACRCVTSHVVGCEVRAAASERIPSAEGRELHLVSEALSDEGMAGS
mmetsp:Transcript_20420/g.56818  ORF Transcript_20420/g.56818 Transcript_20420/m.56818 type:complete len:250 (-) Transcript_20420:146-895(-)